MHFHRVFGIASAMTRQYRMKRDWHLKRIFLLLTREFHNIIDEIDVRGEHSPATISIKVKLLEDFFRGNIGTFQL